MWAHQGEGERSGDFMLKAISALCGGLLALPLVAATPVDTSLSTHSARMQHVDIGLSTSGARIQGMVVAGPAADSPTVLLIGGLNGNDASYAQVREQARHFETLSAAQRGFRLLVIPLANPDAVKLQFPPAGVAYRENAEANALWRWIGVHAPDLVLIAGGEDFGLAQALASNAVAEVGSIPARDVPKQLRAIIGNEGRGLTWPPHGQRGLLELATGEPGTSPAHRELNRRLARTPRQLADELAVVYGHDLDAPLYIQAIALIAQARLGHLNEVKKLAEPYVNGTRNSLENANSLVLAGHMIFTELARQTGDARYTQLVRKAADLGFEPDGMAKESMPYHNQYSDSVFMGTIVAAQAGALTGERKYFDMAARHVEFMQKLVLRPDGLYRHSPLTDAAWGRGNAFPAIGLALALSEFPQDHPARARLLRDFQAHMAVLARYQDHDGLWRNVVDYPGAYAEFSATAMIGFSMLRGVRKGWLPADLYQPVVDKAWRAVLARVGPQGHIVDGCESTLKMKSTQEYLHRAALLGVDPRSGAMAMLFAIEMAGL